LLRGQGRFVDDIVLPRMLHAAFVRSPHAHAAVLRIDAARARAVEGAVAVLGAAELGAGALVPRASGGGFTPTTWPALAREPHFCGEAVAVVAASSPYAAADAVEHVHVDYDPRAACVSLEQALRDEAVLFRRVFRRGDVEGVFATAPVVVRETCTHGRLTAAPLEPRGLVADWDGETLTVWASTQTPRIMRSALAAALELSEACVRVIAPDVGGGFGLKMHVFPEDVAIAALARRLGRPVKWIETRRENLAAASQAREQRVDAEVAADETGRLLALRSRVVSDAGAYHIYPLTAMLEPLGTANILPGPYVTPAYAYEAIAVRTHKPPLGAYRGVGMTMGAFVMERLLDLVAARIGLDPAEVRRRNLIPREAYPHVSPSGLRYDSGDFPKALEQALAAVEYDSLREAQREARRRGELVGIGLACYTEYTGMGSEVFRGRGMDDVPGIEAASVRVEPDGSVRCATSFPSQGQGHATTIAQIVADRLGVPLERVRVDPTDTRVAPLGSGTFGSRGAVSIGGTVTTAVERLQPRIQRIAAHLLEASAADVVLEDGRAYVRGFPQRVVTLAEVARAAYRPPGDLPADLEPGLETTVHFDPPGPTFSGAVHVAVVEIDPETGRVTIPRYVLVEDCGPVVNPTIVEGQIHGAVAQGIGEALFERIVHDDAGQIVTGTLMDYALPKADDVPSFAIGHLETPSPTMPGGIKGMGEGGTIGAPAAVANAVADAVAPLGLSITALPIAAERLARLSRPPQRKV
jgi:carbon-monoxide dehydrogenase large subunit